MTGKFDSKIECDGNVVIVTISQDGDDCATERQILDQLKATVDPSEDVIFALDDNCCDRECVMDLAVKIRRRQGSNGGRTAIVAPFPPLYKRLAGYYGSNGPNLNSYILLSTDIETARQQLAA